jgi:hypothetical protein
MEALVFAANGMYVTTYFTDDLLRVRLLTIAAAACLAAYFYTRPEPLMTVVGWNLFFVGLNVFQIARILRARNRSRRRGPRVPIPSL